LSALPADPHSPDFRSLFEVVPRKLTGVFRLKLAVERSRIMVVDQNERIAWLERRERVENERVALARYKITHVEWMIVGHFSFLAVDSSIDAYI
jgi:hypothetical protein